MRKRDVLSIVENPVRSNIIARLAQAGKAGYSDLLDSAGIVGILDSRGNFNYHLNFLIKSRIVVKDSMVYRLTERGRALARFVKEVNQIFEKVEPKLRGGYMDMVSYAEDFEKETGIRMQKATNKRKVKGNVEIIVNENSVMGILAEEKCKDWINMHSGDYQKIQFEDFRLSVKPHESKSGKKCNYYVLGHPDLSYYLSLYYVGSVLHYLQVDFEEAYMYADKRKPLPFLIRAKRLQERYEGPAFMIAPAVFGV